MKKIVLSLILLILFVTTNAQLVVNTGMTPTQYVQNVLAGSGVVITNVTFIGDTNQLGEFNSAAANVGIGQGIILSTGDVATAVGPNNNTGLPGSQYGGPADLDLNITSGVTTEDAAVLEFDFIPTGDTIKFNYVFASEEYLEFLNTGVNDAFGFFLSGPGITGPYSNNAINLATIPGTTTEVSIDSVNNVVNSTFYIDNGDGNSAPQNTDNTVIQYDGLTVVLTAVSAVQCGQPYHIKLAIADGGDDQVDSGVFLEGGSLTSSGVSITSNTTTIIEGCVDATIKIQRSDINANDTIGLVVSGNATTQEYSTIPLQQVFAPGSDSIVFDIAAFVDNVAEGTDTIIIEIQGNTGCNMITLIIEDYIPMSITVSDSVNICEELGESALLWMSVSDGRPPFSYVWDNGGGSRDSVNVAPQATTYYTPTIWDGCGNSIVGDAVPVIVQCEIIKINVFTPNGDGMNDFFTLTNLADYPNPSVKIFNRWGAIVYESESYQNDWDGDDLTDGTYFYVVFPNSNKYEYDSGAKGDLKHTIKGYFHLFR